MTDKPTPRNLDPKFKDAEVPADADARKDSESDPVNRTDSAKHNDARDSRPEDREETPNEVMARMASGEVANDPDEGNIVFRQSVVDSAGNTVQKEHGPMPRGEWAEYSAKNGL